MTPGTLRQSFGDALERARGLLRIADEACRDRDDEGLHFLGRVKPGSTCRIAMKVRIISPETISSVSANATCPTTSALRVRCRAGRVARRSAAFLERRQCSGSRTCARQTRRRSRPLSTEMASVKSNTMGSMPISSTRGSSAGAIHRSSSNARPARAPRRARRPRGPARRSPTAARARCGRGSRRAPRASRAPDGVPPRAPGTGSPRCRTR